MLYRYVSSVTSNVPILKYYVYKEVMLYRV